MAKEKDVINKKFRGYISRKKIKVAIISSCASVILLGTTAFAWFTLTNQARVSEIKMKAGTESGLLIGHTPETVSKKPIEFTYMDDGVSYCIRPITSIDGKKFYAPIYGTAGKVTKVESTALDVNKVSNKSEENEGYMITYKFYLKAESNSRTEPVGIRLASAQADEEGVGTKVNQNKNAAAGAEAAIRMSFSANGTTTIYEPNADKKVASRAVQVKKDGWTSVKTIKQASSESGMFAQNLALPNEKVDYTSTVSPELFKIPINKATQVTLHIWLEGSDEDCVNEIAADQLISNFTFVCTDLN